LITKVLISAKAIRLNQFLYIKPAFKQFAILNEDALNHVAIVKLIQPEDAYFVKDSYAQLLQEDLIQHVEFRILLPDETFKTIRVEAFIISMENRVKVITGNIVDLTSFEEHNDILNKFFNKKMHS
jgi:hypothetical protein